MAVLNFEASDENCVEELRTHATEREEMEEKSINYKKEIKIG